MLTTQPQRITVDLTSLDHMDLIGAILEAKGLMRQNGYDGPYSIALSVAFDLNKPYFFNRGITLRQRLLEVVNVKDVHHYYHKTDKLMVTICQLSTSHEPLQPSTTNNPILPPEKR